MSTDPEFDWSQAESLLGDDPQNVPPEMAEIVGELVEGSRARFDELKKLNPDTDRPKISAQAHQLRGSLLNFGFTGVGERLFHVERKEYATAEYPGLMELAETAFHDSLRMLSERYPTLNLP